MTLPARFKDVEAVTFDCYGTLIDWETGLLAAFKSVFARRKITVGDSQLFDLYAHIESEVENGAYRPYREVLSETTRRIAVSLGFKPTEEELGLLTRELPGWRPFSDTVAALKRFKPRYKLVVISNIDKDLFSHTAKLLEVPFDGVVTAEDARSYKPSRNNFEQASRLLGLPYGKILHAAQSLYHDVAPASLLGMATAWVNRHKGQIGGGATREATAKPDVEVADLKSLADLLGV